MFHRLANKIDELSPRAMIQTCSRIGSIALLARTVAGAFELFWPSIGLGLPKWLNRPLMHRASRRRRVPSILGCLVSLCVVFSSAAAFARDAADGAPAAIAARVEKGPILDGAVLEDPVWAAVEPITGFWQTTPEEGQPGSEHTEVRIAYSSDTLYFGVVCYDREPSRIIISESRRDSSLEETDSFQMVHEPAFRLAPDSEHRALCRL